MAKDEFGEGMIKHAIKRRPVRVIEAVEALGATGAVATLQAVVPDEIVANAASWAVAASAAVSITLKEVAQNFTTSWLDPMARIQDRMDGEDCDELLAHDEAESAEGEDKG